MSGLGSLYNDTGVVFAPQLGSLGSIVVTGGGHNDYYGNEVYRYDVSSRLFSRLTNPNDVIRNPNFSGDMTDRTLGEEWADATFTSTLPNEPGGSHNYGYQVILPIGTAGTLMIPALSVLSPNGAAGRQPHSLDLAAQLAAGPATSTWRRFGPTNTSLTAFGGACLDTKRNCVWASRQPSLNQPLMRLDLSAISAGWTSFGAAFPVSNSPILYAPEYDIIVNYKNLSTGGVLMFINPVTGIKTIPTQAGQLPPWSSTPHSGEGSEWCSDLPGGAGLISYSGMGDFDVYIARPSAGLTTWTWTKQTLTGDTPPVQYAIANCMHVHRFVYVPTIRSFLWLSTTKDPVQAWRLFE